MRGRSNILEMLGEYIKRIPCLNNVLEIVISHIPALGCEEFRKKPQQDKILNRIKSHHTCQIGNLSMRPHFQKHIFKHSVHHGEQGKVPRGMDRKEQNAVLDGTRM